MSSGQTQEGIWSGVDAAVVVCGGAVFARVFERVDPTISVKLLAADGTDPTCSVKRDRQDMDR